ncbi:uncharacterized protein PFL1_00727 [Pseudozyma flocculosa PF-1]|uniref:uncharacterized protein n=1 Tax=Pseudozyma flocculosa PF-1 TaxID=1277687 RepID=UPI0004561BB2|nr:uncharacterized protein PFL1_00727 [Pseudozyma flocculosa PF-1]EPQ31392.1 hypothetical protein PFL1_00727 [Pseudozyma flocculosa PF-1]
MPPTKPKGGKMMTLINYRLRITLNDSRQIVGQLLAFDNHMNLVLADSQEYRKVKSKKAKAKAAAAAAAASSKAAGAEDDDDEEENEGATQGGLAVPEQKRTLGMLILRGENIVSMSIESPPPADTQKDTTLPPGPGRPMAMGRGIGLAGPPPPGMGGAGAPPMMARPMAYARPPPPPGMPGMPPPPGMPSGPPPGFAARPRQASRWVRRAACPLAARRPASLLAGTEVCLLLGECRRLDARSLGSRASTHIATYPALLPPSVACPTRLCHCTATECLPVLRNEVCSSPRWTQSAYSQAGHEKKALL